MLNERRQNYENRPYGLASMAIMSALYPPDHPYHWPTIGAAEDVRAARLDEVREFFQRYYHPANATLAIAGDIETGRAFDLARAYFEDIPAGPAAAARMHRRRRSSAPPKSRLMLEDRVELPRLYLAWRTPRTMAEGDADLDLIADLLANDKTSRLYRRLVHDRRLATEVAAGQGSREWSSAFQVVATAAPGHTLAELDEAITEEIEDLRAAGPREAELERVIAGAEATFVYRLQSVGGFGGKADQLNAYNVLVGDPGFVEEDLRALYDGNDRAVAGCGARLARIDTTDRVERRSSRPAAPGIAESQLVVMA